MQAEIIPELFMKNLRAVPSKKPDKHSKRLKRITPGAAYLYRAVIIPKMQEKTVNTSEINMDAFEISDIETVYRYCEKNVAVDRPENRVLYELYDRLQKTAPLISQTKFL